MFFFPFFGGGWREYKETYMRQCVKYSLRGRKVGWEGCWLGTMNISFKPAIWLMITNLWNFSFFTAGK